MEENKKSMVSKLLMSSANPNQVSVMIKGLMIMGAGFLVPQANLGEADVANVVDAIINVGKVVIQLGGILMALFGAVRKMVIDFKEFLAKLKK